MQQAISGDQKVKEVKQEGEKKVSQMKQQLREERKQKEEEIDLLKRSGLDDMCMSLLVINYFW